MVFTKNTMKFFEALAKFFIDISAVTLVYSSNFESTSGVIFYIQKSFSLRIQSNWHIGMPLI